MRWFYFSGLVPEIWTSTLTVVGDRLFGISRGVSIEITRTNIVAVKEYCGQNAFLRVTTIDGDFHVGLKSAEYDEVVRILRQLVGDNFCQTLTHRSNVLLYRTPLSLRRFSLRTLLIAMTIIAVGLGLIMWLSRTG